MTTPRASRLDHPARRERDLYEFLEVSPLASPEVIKAAYRVLARRYHPDVAESSISSDGGLHMRQLNAAYKLLTDPDRRARYDRHRARKAARPRLSVHAHPGAATILTLRPSTASNSQNFDISTPRLARRLMAMLFIGVALVVVAVTVWAAVELADDQPPPYSQRVNAVVFDSPPPGLVVHSP